MFCAMLAGGGVRAAPGVMILPLERAFGWSLGTISSAVSINIILLGYRAAPDRSGPGDRSEAYDPGVYGAIGSRHGPVALYDRAGATLHYLGLHGRDRRRWRRRRCSGGNRKSLVRGEERSGNGAAQRRERSRAAGLSAAARAARSAVRLAGRRGCGYRRDRCDGPGGRNFAARVAGSGLTAQPPTEGDGHHQAIRSQSR